MEPPRVFISYSHDSAKHKKWVLDIATTLRNRGVDAILDQWDLKPGDDLPHFMEQNLETSDFAVMVCTTRYVTKANAGEGGVGYEKMIMTSSSLSKISNNKVIPIVRERGDPCVPTFLKTKLYIDFVSDDEIEFALDELLRVLLNAPLYQKPKIGSDPYCALSEARPNKTADGIRSAMEALAAAYNDNPVLGYPMRDDLIVHSAMHRLTLDKYLVKAAQQGLIKMNESLLAVTEKGLTYLEEHNIIDT